jgi:hypothetical protein
MLLLKVRLGNCVSKNLVYWEKENGTLCAHVKRRRGGGGEIKNALKQMELLT